MTQGIISIYEYAIAVPKRSERCANENVFNKCELALFPGVVSVRSDQRLTVDSTELSGIVKLLSAGIPMEGYLFDNLGMKRKIE